MNITFRPFEPVDNMPETRQSYTLRKPTNARVDAICEILFSQQDADLERRLYYLKHHSNPPVLKSGESSEIDLPQRYESSNVYGFLAQELFLGFPEVCNFDAGGIFTNDKLFPAIDRAEVYRALDFFFSSFGVMLYESKSLESVFQLARQLQSPQGGTANISSS